MKRDVMCIRHKRSADKVLAGKWYDNTKSDLKEIGWGKSVDWILMASSFSRRTLHHRVSELVPKI
jgi:hypothetical protein